MKFQGIVVIGGYGHVGQQICRRLAVRFPGRVFAAGRSMESAKRFCQSSQLNIQPMRIDAQTPPEPGLAEHAQIVIMCLDHAHPDFARFCLEHRIHYIDISADPQILSRTERLHETAVMGGATAVLSVGMAPGLTNLLAAYCASRLETVERVDIGILLGLGDNHGQAAIDWTLSNVNAEYHLSVRGQSVRVRSLDEGKGMDFGGILGTRTAYRFNFSDQHTLARTLSLPEVTTRLCFDSIPLTRLLALFKRTGLLKVLNRPGLRRRAVELMGKTAFGTEVCALTVEAQGRSGEKSVQLACRMRGTHEAAVTAAAAAAVASSLLEDGHPAGVYHIEQLFRLDRLLPAFESHAVFEAMENGRPVPLV